MRKNRPTTWTRLRVERLESRTVLSAAMPMGFAALADAPIADHLATLRDVVFHTQPNESPHATRRGDRSYSGTDADAGYSLHASQTVDAIDPGWSEAAVLNVKHVSLLVQSRAVQTSIDDASDPGPPGVWATADGLRHDPEIWSPQLATLFRGRFGDTQPRPDDASALQLPSSIPPLRGQLATLRAVAAYGDWVATTTPVHWATPATQSDAPRPPSQRVVANALTSTMQPATTWDAWIVDTEQNGSAQPASSLSRESSEWRLRSELDFDDRFHSESIVLTNWSVDWAKRAQLKWGRADADGDDVADDDQPYRIDAAMALIPPLDWQRHTAPDNTQEGGFIDIDNTGSRPRPYEPRQAATRPWTPPRRVADDTLPPTIIEQHKTREDADVRDRKRPAAAEHRAEYTRHVDALVANDLEEGGMIGLVATAHYTADRRDATALSGTLPEIDSAGDADNIRMDKGVGLFQAVEVATLPALRTGPPHSASVPVESTGSTNSASAGDESTSDDTVSTEAASDGKAV